MQQMILCVQKNSRVPYEYNFLSISKLTSPAVMNKLGGKGGEEKMMGFKARSR